MRLERLDPLYCEGSPTAMATGTKSVSTFINSNVNALSLSLRMQPTQRDTLTVRHARIRANELRNPVQFDQATRVDTSGEAGGVVSGVTRKHLADDVFVEWNRVITQSPFSPSARPCLFRALVSKRWAAGQHRTGRAGLLI